MLAVATHAQVTSVIGPAIMLLFCLALPTVLVRTVIRAISMSAQQRRMERAIQARFYATEDCPAADRPVHSPLSVRPPTEITAQHDIVPIE